MVSLKEPPFQGKLTDGANPANGSYDFQFTLFDSLSGGTQIGSPLTRSAVAVNGGIFTVELALWSQRVSSPESLSSDQREACRRRQLYGAFPAPTDQLNTLRDTVSLTKCWRILRGKIATADMNLQGYRLHRLKGNRADTWSISVSGNWRVTLRSRAKMPSTLTLKIIN